MKYSKKWVGLFNASLGFIALTFGARGGESYWDTGFGVSGIISRSFVKPGRTNASFETKAEFITKYSNGWWSIDLVYIAPKPGRPSVHSAMSVPDGVRSYTLFSGSTNKGLIPATICPVSFPNPGQTEMFAIWIALSPRPELPVIDGQTIRRFTLLPGCDLEILRHPKNIGTYSEERLEGEGRYLSRLSITNNGIMIDESESPEKGQIETVVKSYPPPWNLGFLEFDYRLITTTNWNGMVIPRQGVLTLFTMDPVGRQRGNPHPSQTLTFVVTNAFPLSGFKSFKSTNTPAKLYAKDLRPPNLPKDIAVGYVVKDDNWKSATNAFVKRLADLTRKQHSVLPPAGVKHSRITVIVVLGSIFFIPILLMLLRRVKESSVEKPIK